MGSTAYLAFQQSVDSDGPESVGGGGGGGVAAAAAAAAATEAYIPYSYQAF